jgi:hypothetical protein
MELKNCMSIAIAVEVGFREFCPWFSRIRYFDIDVTCIHELRGYEGWVELLRMESIACGSR